MIYSLLIVSSPNTGQSVHTAALFAEQLILQNHKIHRVFFLDAAVQTALSTSIYTQEEINPGHLWVQLAAEHQLDLTVCITSALRYGVLDEREARHRNHAAITLHPAFTIGGLGLLIEACAHSDRVITFGGQ